MAWQIDPAHTSINFSVKHMMFSTVNGRFTDFEGQIQADSNNPVDSTVTGTIDVDSINTGVADRDNHLRSADFFDVENFPQMTFESTEITRVADDRYKVKGNLTIKAVTNEVVWDVESHGQGQDPWGNTRWGVAARTTIDRTDYGLTWNQMLETGGVLVGNTIKINAELQLVEQQEAAQEAEPVTA